MSNTIEVQAKVSLDTSIEQLEPGVEQKLANIRHQALNQASKKSIPSLLFGKSMALSACSLVVVALLSSYLFNSENKITPRLLTQHELQEDPELLAELEFVYWLSEEEYEEIIL